MHQQEFEERKAFAYTDISLDEEEVLGCLYIKPPRGIEVDAVVHMWDGSRLCKWRWDLVHVFRHR